MGSITTRVYVEGEEVVEGHHLEMVSELLAEQRELVWIDLDDPIAGDLQRARRRARPAPARRSRTPSTRTSATSTCTTSDHVFLVCHAIELDVERAELRTIELNVFIGDAWLVTVHRGHGELHGPRRRPLGPGPPARRDQRRGRSMYAVLDVIVDGYFDAIDGSSATTTTSPTRSSASHRSSRRSTASGSRCASR